VSITMASADLDSHCHERMRQLAKKLTNVTDLL
jgi:hypothetical protein